MKTLLSKKHFYLLLLLCAVAAYLGWSQIGRASLPHEPKAYIQSLQSYGQNHGQGNLVGIQPWMEPKDYQNQRAFAAKMDLYFRAAKQAGWLGSKSIVVLPEYLGTWLAVAEEKPSVYEAQTIEEGITKLVLANLPSFLWSYLQSQSKAPVKEAVFRMKAPLMARIYESVFSGLAKRYAVSIVAGSILLPNPHVEQGRLKMAKGPLYNVSALFLPDGRLAPKLVRKVYPTSDEQPFLAAAKQESLPVLQTPAGSLGILICADSWFPESYRELKRKGAKLLVVPSYSAPDGLWDTKWKGYSGFANPRDVAQTDIGKITEGEAWQKYALPGRIKKKGFLAGLNVFLRGRLWDLGSDGGSLLYLHGKRYREKRIIGAALSNLWL